MKKIVSLLTLTLSGLLAAPAEAQQALPCGTYQAMEEYMRQNPEYARQLREYEEQIRQISENPVLRGPQLTNKVIPVVVHIIHNNGASNISNAQVHNAMEILNNDFNRLNADTADVIQAFKPLAANAEVTFRLARLDPNGNCSEGITRTFSSSTNSAGENVKSLIRWDPAKYLNVWVVNNIASGAGGYSYLPCPNAGMDGIVIRNSQFGSIGTSSPWGLAMRSFTHEVGHYLGLPHTWGGSNTPGLASNCDIDDGIADTPNTVGVTGGACNTAASTCGNLNNVQNFMDYSNCPLMFTLGQKAVMQNALTNLGCRTSLWDQNNLVATGTNDGFSILSCTPAVAFEASTTLVCEGNSVTFTDQSYNPAFNPNISRLWSFPGGNPSTSTSPNPTVQYSTPGVYEVSLTVTNQGGPTTLTKAGLIEVRSMAPALALPLLESFEQASFPVVPSDTTENWELESSTTNTWQRTNTAAAEGSWSMRIRHSLIPGNRVNALVTPVLDLTTVPQPSLRFMTAYALPTSGSSTDRFEISYSTNCGQTWQGLYLRQGSGLASVANPENNFTPNDLSEWRADSVDLPNEPSLMLRFESTSGNGNTLYLDAVNIGNYVVGLADNQLNTGFSIFPNPATQNATLRYSLSKPGTTQITLTNLLGMPVAQWKREQAAGVQEIQLSEISQRLMPGVYAVTLYSGTQTITRKLVIQ